MPFSKVGFLRPKSETPQLKSIIATNLPRPSFESMSSRKYYYASI